MIQLAFAITQIISLCTITAIVIILQSSFPFRHKRGKLLEPTDTAVTSFWYPWQQYLMQFQWWSQWQEQGRGFL